MHIEFFVEEPSMEVLLDKLHPLLLREGVTYRCHVFSGKIDLLQHLPNRLAGLHWIPQDWRIVVLVDEDRQDCKMLKTDLEEIAIKAGFRTKSNPATNGKFKLLNRIVIEELEAWYFGDPQAVKAAYPRFKSKHARKSDLAQPDSCKGGTWEAFERALQASGYYKTGLPKKEVAALIAANMDPVRNTSPSFQAFFSGLKALQAA